MQDKIIAEIKKAFEKISTTKGIEKNKIRVKIYKKGILKSLHYEVFEGTQKKYDTTLGELLNPTISIMASPVLSAKVSNVTTEQLKNVILMMPKEEINIYVCDDNWQGKQIKSSEIF
ncbi:MAG: hypothetical protein PHT69_02080 [Bacteroidales bacterium]|nr:hypothetical protein [Bacteroidales bacterium]